MDLSEAKVKAIKLINEYSKQGGVISSTKNADYLLRMNDLANDAQFEIADILNIKASYDIAQVGNSEDGYNEYALPSDYKELRFISINHVPYTGYIKQDNKLYIPKRINDTLTVYYNKKPTEITDATPDTYVFEIDTTAHNIIPYYMGGMVIADETPAISDKLLNIYYSKLEKLKPVSDDCPNTIASVYGW